MNEKGFRLLIKNVPSGIVVYDSQSKIIQANSIAEKLLGVEKLIGRDTNDPVWFFLRENGERLPVTEYPSNQVLSTGKPISSLTIGITNPGKNKIIWILVNGTPIFNEREELAEVLISFVDITELKQVENKLKKELIFQNDEKEKRAEELKIANIELIFQNYEKEKRAEELKIANKELAFQDEEKEKRAEELSIANIELAFQDEEKEKRAEELKIANKELIFQNNEKEKRAEELKIANKELIFQNNEKEKRAEELKIANKELIFQNDEKEKRAEELGIANKELVFQNEEKEKRAEELKIANIDIIERKRVEVELENAKKVAEDANQMKSVFLANMSHEIRTPLNAIVGFSSILKEKNQDNKVNTEYLDNIIQSSKVLLNLINDILDLSKVEAGRMVIDFQPVNLNNLIKEIQTIFLMKATEKGILINIQIADNIPENIITDEKFLRQILFNLIGNSVKFTHDGNVDIIIDLIPKKEGGSKIDLVISVKDSGIGIPENQFANIFEPFTQLDNKSSNKYGGTGLGLSITKRLTELLGGTITVKSEYGKGSVFSVSLFNIEIGTLNNSNDMNIEKSWLKNIRFKNPVLLIAEDVLSNRQVLRGYLETLNITIIETENGEDCISVARKTRPDIILMDMQMPVMDGYTAINILKLDRDLKTIPIIALTASGMKHEKDRFGSIANDILLKPIYKYELVELLTKYLPYEQLNETEKAGTEPGNISIPINTEEELPIETKVELNKKFMPTIIKLQKSLNFDDLISFGKELEMCPEKSNIIKNYCARLNDSIATFDTDKIYAGLSELTTLINK